MLKKTIRTLVSVLFLFCIMMMLMGQSIVAYGSDNEKEDTNIMIDYTGNEKNAYQFGDKGDQQDRYQTFTTNEGFDMEYVQIGIKKRSSDTNDLIIKLYKTNSDGLPEGSSLTKTIVSSDEVNEGGLTTARLSYKLKEDTRYAIVLTSPKNQNYQWIVTDKTQDSKNEYFGKSISGKFVSEADLGTGILKVIKKLTVDRESLKTLIEEVNNFNKKMYTSQSWSSLIIAIDNANKYLYNFDSTQAELDKARNDLQSAIENLKLSISIEEIDNQIAKIDSATVKYYTDDSVNYLREAVEAAKNLGNNASENDKIEAYNKVLNAIDHLEESGQYQYETNQKQTTVFGFEGDKNASLAFLDGSYQIGGSRPSQHGPTAPKQMVTFGVTDTDNVKWYNKDGYFPSLVSEYTKDDVEYKIVNFANKHTVNSKDYVINYSRVITTNNSNGTRLLSVVSNNLIPLNDNAKKVFVIEPGETVVRDYAIEADKYEYFEEGVREFASLTSEQVINQGDFDENYNGMKTYWENRLEKLIDINLPNEELVNAFKAGYIYTMIVKDKTYLHVGENGYARLFSHDTIGILVQLIQSGDFKHAKSYLESVPLTGGKNIETGEIDPNQYWDANWKLSWAYAVYLSKTGDISVFTEQMTDDDGSTGTIFEKRVKHAARSIADDRTDDGIMKETYAIDDKGQWTVDNYSALTGLASYEYISRELYKQTSERSYLEEAKWAKDEYDNLLDALTNRLQRTIAENDLNYIPVSVIESNDENRTKDSRDANWASMFEFGRWTWDGYLFGAEQPEDNINISMLDQTYTYGINRRLNDKTTDSPYNFGGYPHGFYSSSYNAGYGSAALRGKQYRDLGIKAYEFMIENTMSGPFSWWEGIDFPEKESPWTKTNDDLNLQNTPGGGGSAPHMWGQSVNSKVLIDSLISERIYDQNNKIDIIVGRGIPKEWVKDAASNNNVVADVQNYPALQGGRVGYKIVRHGNDLVVTFDSNINKAKIDPKTDVNVSIQLPVMVDNIADTTAGTIDNDKGIVTLPINTKKVTISLDDLGSSVKQMKKLVENFKEEGKIKNDVVARVLQTHLTAVGHYEETGKMDKAIKHMKGLKQLLDNQEQNGLISEEVSSTLLTHASMLITDWQ
ncbi:hypothetical protein KK120_13300 [Virgibacillus dakarensis]|nr:hypothetical protein [Virgibacillus dakarensis]